MAGFHDQALVVICPGTESNLPDWGCRSVISFWDECELACLKEFLDLSECLRDPVKLAQVLVILLVSRFITNHFDSCAISQNRILLFLSLCWILLSAGMCARQGLK